MIQEKNFKASLLNKETKDKWERISIHRRAGVLVPLFSIYSKASLGIGDLADLRLVVDWCNKTGNSILQPLPLNALGFTFCPYDALSSFALEPAYLSLSLIVELDNRAGRGKIEEIKRNFPVGRPYVDYRISQVKIRILRQVYLKEGFKNSSELKQFKKENVYWLEDFALFMALKDYHQGRPWHEWEPEYRDRDKRSLEIFYHQHQREIDFQIWLQWQLFQQLKAVKEYAKKKKVLLKGDLPILAARDSADVWVHRQYFKLEFAAGSPSDMYCAKGQRWDMPTYNWEKIARDKFRYLNEKLKYAENFYDILRIDHVVGLFRIWSIAYNEPKENLGLNGFFDPKDELIWPGHGRKILSQMLANTEMLLCAEDLGMIPKTCPETLEELGIPGNDVQRWVKDWKVKHNFLRPQEFRLLSVAMLSTHDTTNWPAWWENEAGTIDEALFIRKCNQYGIDYQKVKHQLFDSALSRHGRLRWLNNVTSLEIFLEILGKRKKEVADLVGIYENSFQEKEKLWRHLNISAPLREKSDPEIIKAALKISLDSRSLFCINTIIDWLFLTDILKGSPYQYRINTPGTISDKNWSVVVPIGLEELLRHKVNKEIKAMIAASGRI